MRTTPLAYAALALLPALAACGGKAPTQPEQERAAAQSSADIELSDEADQPGGRSGAVTRIDAAAGSARGMPGDYHGPSAFDLQASKAGSAPDKDKDDSRPARPAEEPTERLGPAATPGEAAELLSDDSVTAGD
ncbi:MAG: hypothetical protein JWM38_1333 [Sphingomonas bacterium]|jgi:predicted small lipoprotein YifL|nr:hypothetical protein [Sphingomonas bacterium]